MKYDRNQAGQAIAHIAVAAHNLRHGGDPKKLSQRIDAMLMIVSGHLRFRKSTIQKLAFGMEAAK